MKHVAPNWDAILPFLAFLVLTLWITRWASRRNRSAADFYAASGGISPRQNGFALAGDFLSAASFLGAIGLITSNGFDGLVYGVGALIGWPLLLFLVAEPLRNLGRFTLADVVSFRLRERPTRILVATNSLVIILFYLVIQMVGAGQVIQLLFGLPYGTAVSAVAGLVLIYVLWGGMLGTTWLQIIKAVLILTVGTSLGYMVLRATGFSVDNLLLRTIQAHPRGASALAPSGLMANPIDALSLGASLVFGLVGLPHVLTRLFTVKNGASARKSVFYATAIIAYFYVVIDVIGAGVVAFVFRDSHYQDPVTHKLIGGTNMAAMHLAHYFGGDLYLGLLSALVFAMILAVVAGLTISGASIIGHDLYTRVRGRPAGSSSGALIASRVATVALIVLAVLLSQAVQHLNVAFLFGLALSISASTNFPVLMLTLYWRGLTTRGVLAAGITGLVSSIVLLITGPTFWVGTFGFSRALFPYNSPTLFSMTLAFAAAWLLSITDQSKRAKFERDAFGEQLYRSMTGIGAADPVSH